MTRRARNKNDQPEVVTSDGARAESSRQAQGAKKERQARIKQLERSLAKKKEVIKKLGTSLSEMQAERRDEAQGYEHEIASLRATKDELQRQLTRSQLSQKQLASELKDERVANHLSEADLRVQCAGLEAERDQARLRVGALEKQAKDWKAKYNACFAQANACSLGLQQENSQLQALLASLQHTLAQQQQAREADQQQLRMLESQCEQLRGESPALHAQPRTSEPSYAENAVGFLRTVNLDEMVRHPRFSPVHARQADAGAEARAGDDAKAAAQSLVDSLGL